MGAVGGVLEDTCQDEMVENGVGKGMIDLLVHWQGKTLQEVVGCPFQYDEVGYDWEKEMTFGRACFIFWGRESCCDNVGRSAPMSWKKAAFTRRW